MLDSARQNSHRYRKQYQDSSHTRDQILRLLSLKNCIYQYENTEDEIKECLDIPQENKVNIASRTECQTKKKKLKKNHQTQKFQGKMQMKQKTQSQRFIRRRENIQNTKKQLLRGSSHLKMRSESQNCNKKSKGKYNSIQFRNPKSNMELTTIKNKARTLSHMNNKTKTGSQVDNEGQDQYNSQMRLKQFVTKYRNNIQIHKAKLRETDLQHQKIQEIINEMTGFQQNIKKHQESISQLPNQFPQKISRTLEVASKIPLRTKQNKKQQVVKGVLKQRYQILQKIGKGLSGQVYKGKDILSNRFVAIKVIGQQVENKQREYQFYKKVQHKNIVNYLNNFVQNGKRYLVLQYFPYNLQTVAKKRKLVLEQIKIIFKNIVNSLMYLHGLSIAHRDIKLQNIVCSEDLAIIKLIDFGLCIDLNEQSINISNQFCGTVHYMPPQMLQKKFYDPKKADIWSLGVLLYKLSFDRYPYRGKDEKEVLSKIYKTKLVFPQYCNQDLRKLIQAMLIRNSSQRATITEVIQHRWLV